MCYFNRLTRVARWLADYPEWLQFCWDFIKPPRNDEVALKPFVFLACSSARISFYLICAACNFFLPTSACRKFFSKSPTLENDVVIISSLLELVHHKSKKIGDSAASSNSSIWVVSTNVTVPF